MPSVSLNSYFIDLCMEAVEKNPHKYQSISHFIKVSILNNYKKEVKGVNLGDY